MKLAQKLIFFISLFSINFAYSQDIYDNISAEKLILNTYTKARYNSGFSWDNFSIGVKGGVNFSLIIPFSRHSVFTGASPNDYRKDYVFFLRNRGYQMGFILMYDITKILKVSIQPSANNYKYTYLTNYSWAGNTNLQIESEYSHKLRFFELPLIVGFYTTYPTWQPYFQGGIYWGQILDATTVTDVIETSTNLVGSENSQSYTTLANSTELYKRNQYGVMGGAGIMYNAGRTKIGIEANYRIVLSNLNSVETQFMNNQVVSGSYDVPDKFKFSNLAINLNLIVPLVCRSSSTRSGSVFCQ